MNGFKDDQFYNSDEDSDYNPLNDTKNNSDEDDPKEKHRQEIDSQETLKKKSASGDNEKQSYDSLDYGLDVEEVYKSMKNSDEKKCSKDWMFLVSSNDNHEFQKKKKINIFNSSYLMDNEKQVYNYSSSNCDDTQMIQDSTEFSLISDEPKTRCYSSDINIKNNYIKSGSCVTVMRKPVNSDIETELIIKFKRPSLIDKFLLAYNDKSQKLTSLEKSRLDWASFVDARRIKEDLVYHNKAGYLDKQEFLQRVEARENENYLKAKSIDQGKNTSY